MLEYGHVYAIIDPREPEENGILGSFFYVGLTLRTIPNRLIGHVSDSKKHRGRNVQKERKIRSIIDAGLYPQIISLQEAPRENLKYLERFYIEILRLFGAVLTNISPGGDFNPMTDLSPERIGEIIEKSRTKNKNIFQKKIEDKCKELKISIEEYPQWRIGQYKEYKKRWKEENISEEDKIIFATKKRERMANLREEMGPQAFKQLIADERRTWFNDLSEERKEEQRQKESVYCKSKRANETHEQKIARRVKVTTKRRAVKQKLIEEIGIEAYRELERNKRKTWTPRKKISDNIREERNRKHREYMASETSEQRKMRLENKKGKRPSRSKEAKLKRQQLKLQQSSQH